MSNFFKCPKGWEIIQEEFEKDYMLELKKFLEVEKAHQKIIYPDEKHIFKALELTSFKETKVVMIGQDPYHGEGQAHGLCFSVPEKIKVPPSLKNIMKELQNDLQIPESKDGNLKAWAKEGVLLLNAVLTVEKGKAGSHHKKGWEIFTHKIIETLNAKKEHLVFILWGSPAQKVEAQISENKHLVLKSVHPSPLSAHRGFFGNHHFSQANKYLEKHHIDKIDWSRSKT